VVFSKNADVTTDTTDPVRVWRNGRSEWFAEVMRRPYSDFMLAAFKYHGEMSTGNAWRSELFHFVWFLRGHPEFTPLLRDHMAALRKVETTLKGWTQAARSQRKPMPHGDTKDHWNNWFGVDTLNAQAEFADVWMKSRYLPGHSPLQQAVDANRRLRLILPDDVAAMRPLGEKSERSEGDYEFFIGIAGHLQLAVGDQDIKLPCENLSKLMGVSKMTVSRYRRWAVDDKFMLLMKAHRYNPRRGAGDATEFRFDLERWPDLRKKAEKTA